MISKVPNTIFALRELFFFNSIKLNFRFLNLMASLGTWIEDKAPSAPVPQETSMANN